jgi:hypothetical protein
VKDATTWAIKKTFMKNKIKKFQAQVGEVAQREKFE